MRRYSKGILNCGVGDGLSSNPNRRTPDHPPYSEMVSVALRSLAEENGSTESSISAYIQSTFNDLPWGHDRLLPYYLKKLVVEGELTCPSPDRYQLPLQSPPSDSLPVRRRRGRPRLNPPNPNPNPSFSLLPSPPPSCRGRSQLHRRRGRPRKILAEGTPLLHLEQGRLPLQRGRGRSRRGRGDAIGLMATRRVALQLPRSRGSKRRQDSFLISNAVGLNCQLGNSALLDDIGNGGSECGALGDAAHIEVGNAQKGDGQPFVAPEQSEVSMGQVLGEEPPLLILEQGTIPLILATMHHEHGEGHLVLGEEHPFEAPEKSEFSQDQSLLGQILPLLTPEPGQDQSLLRERPPCWVPEPGKVIPLLAPEFIEHDHGQSLQAEAPAFMPPEQTDLGQKQSSEAPSLLSPEQPKHEVFEHGQGQSMQGEVPPFVAPEQTKPVQDQSSPRESLPILTPEPGKMPPFLAPEVFEQDQGQLPQGEAPSFMPPEQTELVQEQSWVEPPLLSPKQPEHDHALLLGASEESEDGHEQKLPGVGTTDPKEGELALMLRPDGEEVENAAVSRKKRKSHGRRRSLRLWFES